MTYFKKLTGKLLSYHTSPNRKLAKKINEKLDAAVTPKITAIVGEKRGSCMSASTQYNNNNKLPRLDLVYYRIGLLYIREILL